MGCPIPEYLKKLAVDAAAKKTNVRFSLRCPCGCGRFAVEALAEPGDGLRAYRFRCGACGAAYSLFDARVHGYDGMVGAHGKSPGEGEYRAVAGGEPDGFAVTVKVENELSLDDFIEACGGEYSYGQYADGFSWIWIFIADCRGRKRLLCKRETA